MIKKFLLAILVLLSGTSFSQTASFQSYITGFTNPVDVTHCGDKRLFVVERAGKIKIVKDGVVLSTPFLDIVDQVNDGGGEQGLLGLAFHPSYSTNGFFYVYYCSGTGNGETRVSRFTVSSNPDIANVSSQIIMWSLSQPFSNHKGGDIAFGSDGFLYFAPGDGGGDPGDRAQNMTLDFGKIIRINPQPNGTYTIPSTNPYFNSTNPTTRRIWASGLRNPWRFSFDRTTGDMWIGDVGQNAWEEVDFIVSGDNSGPNFGWRCYEGLVSYNLSGYQGSYDQPVDVQSHTNGWCAIIGGNVYRGVDYPSLQGLYIYTDYCDGRLHSLTSDNFTHFQLSTNGVTGTTSIGEDICGELYATNDITDQLYKIVGPYLCHEDVNRDGVIKYTGSGNDRDPILQFIGGSTPNNSVPCDCCPEDVTGDGFVKYTGSGNDRDPILSAIGGTAPNNTVQCTGQSGMSNVTEKTVTIPPIGIIKVMVDKDGVKKYSVNE